MNTLEKIFNNLLRSLRLREEIQKEQAVKPPKAPVKPKAKK